MSFKLYRSKGKLDHIGQFETKERAAQAHDKLTRDLFTAKLLADPTFKIPFLNWEGDDWEEQASKAVEEGDKLVGSDPLLLAYWEASQKRKRSKLEAKSTEGNDWSDDDDAKEKVGRAHP